MNEQLTKNFKLSEFLISWGSKAYLKQLPQVDQARIYLNILDLATALQILRDKVGTPLIIVSGLRTPDRNTKVGGADKSTHLTGEGCDFIVHPSYVGKLEALLHNFNGGYKHYGDGHFHVDVGSKRRW